MATLVEVVPGSPEWLAARRGGVTATDIVTILGLSSYDSPYSLFWRKLGQVSDEPDRDRWELGKALEPYILRRWYAQQDPPGMSAQRFWAQLEDPQRQELWRSEVWPWQMATLDHQDHGQPVECKSWADADRGSWEAGPPPRVRAQVLWQMDVLDVAAGHVGVVFLPSGRFESYTIEHITNCPRVDGLGIGCTACPDIDLMRAAGLEFYQRMRLELPPPDPDSSAATLAAVRARFTRADAKQAEVDGDLWAHYEGACLMVKAHEELKRADEIRLREQAGEASELCVNGELVARRVIVDAQVKAHTRHADYLRRVKPKEG